MKRMAGVALMLMGSAAVALAIRIDAPEIDPGSAASAFAFLAGALLVIRGRRKA